MTPPPEEVGLDSAAYGELLDDGKARIREARVGAALAVNRVLIELYWEIGREILRREQVEGWGAKIIQRPAADLRREFPGMTGLSRANLQYMRAFAAAWPPTRSRLSNDPLDNCHGVRTSPCSTNWMTPGICSGAHRRRSSTPGRGVFSRHRSLRGCEDGRVLPPPRVTSKQEPSNRPPVWLHQPAVGVSTQHHKRGHDEKESHAQRTRCGYPTGRAG